MDCLNRLDAIPAAPSRSAMNTAQRKWVERVFGSFAREAVRIGFTVYAVRLFVHYAPKTPAECMSDVLGIKTNGGQIFAVILLLTAGLGVAIAMKYVEKKFGETKP